MSNKTKGLLLTLTLSIAIVFIFFGKIIQDPNNYYFSAKGDGFKAYYGAMYHLKYDTSSMRMNGMNYPYGEMVFFTGSQPVVVNTVKFISYNIIDISENIVGIMNLLMIFSIVFAAFFIFLIFFEFKVAWWYSALVSVGICMLSPQIGRFGGHFSLSYLFWIPLMVYLIIEFDKKKTFTISVLIGFATFLAGAMHMYFFGFFGFIIGLYWFSQIFNKMSKTSFFNGILNFSIQYILPVLALQLLISLNDPVSDRTAYPFGFFAYRGHPVAIFFPSGKPYSFVPKFLTVFEHISWESLAFIGVVGLAGFVSGLVLFFKKIMVRGKVFRTTNIPILNVLFWSSFVALLFSFGLPFILGLEWLTDYVGPLRQLRALARFSWLFYYILNILVFYSIYMKRNDVRNRNIWRFVAILAIAFLFFDGFWNIYLNSRTIQNRKSVMEDVANVTIQNEWVNKIIPSEYQAIMPVPYFHDGSENVWLGSKYDTQEITMIASLKTGLPTTGVQLSRTSIEQTYVNYALITEPIEPFELLNKIPNNKPFLLLFNRKHNPNENELRLISAAELIYQNDQIELRKLKVEKLKSFQKDYRDKVFDEYRKSHLFKKNGILTTDSTSWFLIKNFNKNATEIALEGEGALCYPSRKWCILVKDTLENVLAGTKHKISFWMHNYKKDGYLRANIELVQREKGSRKMTNYYYTDVQRHIKAFYGEWALIEFSFETKSNNERIELLIRNSVLKKTEFILDELIIREEGVDLFYQKGKCFFKNGRKFDI